ncbi:MAG: hypothetical protein U0229_00920 [Anaeromyxobacter sp.]
MAIALAAHAPLALVKYEEHLPVPGARGVVSQPFEKRVTLMLAPGASAELLARRLHGDSRLCPKATVEDGAVVLHCTTEMLRADLEPGRGTTLLQLRRLSVPPWRPAEEGPPFAAFDPEAIGLDACPGLAPLSRGECALASGDLAAARREFQAAARSGPSPHAQLRLGDLALADDDPEAAVQAWKKARAEAPWSRLAAMRLCELEPGCIGGALEQTVFDATGVPIAYRSDAILRKARLAVLRGELIETTQALAKETRLDGACKSNMHWCRHLLALALERPPPDGTEALGVYLEWPGRMEGQDALPLAFAAARQAEVAGAPLWAANMLASQTGKIPAARQGEHLLHVGQLYLAGGDRVRAGEILRFARTRLTKRELATPAWTALARALRTPSDDASHPANPADDPDLAAARAALEAAKLAALRKGTAP